MKTNTFKCRRVRVLEGIFRNFSGIVKDVNARRRTAMVSVTLFGRAVLIELPLGRVQELD